MIDFFFGRGEDSKSKVKKGRRVRDEYRWSQQHVFLWTKDKDLQKLGYVATNYTDLFILYALLRLSLHYAVISLFYADL